MFHIQKQIRSLYLSSVLGSLSLTGAWVAILAARGFSLVEIGFAETVFHLTSILFEIPSGILADLYGRKRMLLVSSAARMIGNFVMIFSNHFWVVCLSMVFTAMSYNFSSGSGDALAYDSLKSAGRESYFEKYASNQLIIYRLCGGLSTLCAGFALAIGFQLAYSADLLLGVAQVCALLPLREICIDEGKRAGQTFFWKEFRSCLGESLSFLNRERRAVGLLFANSLVGAADILLLFFLQARLPQAGMPGWMLGFALFFLQMGGILGAKLILKVKKRAYWAEFLAAGAMVLLGVALEHSGAYAVMALGGFLAAAGDDALQVRTNTRLQELFPSRQRATLISIESFTFSVIMIVLSPLAGIFFSHW